MKKIKTQAENDIQQQLNKKKIIGKNKAESNSELQIIAGDFIETKAVSTDVHDFEQYLEEMNGGPLQYEVEMQTSLHCEEAGNDPIDLFEVGAVFNNETFIDPMWRR